MEHFSYLFKPQTAMNDGHLIREDHHKLWRQRKRL